MVRSTFSMSIFQCVKAKTCFFSFSFATCFFGFAVANCFFGFAVANCSAQSGDFFDQANARIEQHRKTGIVVEVVDRFGNAIENANVSVNMKRHEFRWGTAVVASRINSTSENNLIYKQKVLENFNSVVFENDLKWPAWEGAWGSQLGWTQAEQALGWLDANNLPTRGHYAAWGTLSGVDGYGPENTDNDTSQIRDALFSHITDKLTTVGNRVSEWDVINHPIGWGPDTYEETLGENIYVDIMQHARSVAPQGMEMWMNEDNILNGGNTANEYARVLNHMANNGAAADGIGMQGHFKSSWGRNLASTTESIYQQLDRFSEIVDRIQLTEFDIDVSRVDDDGNIIYDEAEHARLMQEYLISAFSHESLEGITMWGFWEDAHWLPEAALFNSDWTEREALAAYRDLVFDQWWTEEQGLTDALGQFSLRGFKGDYEIVVEHDGNTIVRSFDSASGSASIVIGVPEPTSLIPLAIGAMAVWVRRRR